MNPKIGSLVTLRKGCWGIVRDDARNEIGEFKDGDVGLVVPRHIVGWAWCENWICVFFNNGTVGWIKTHVLEVVLL